MPAAERTAVRVEVGPVRALVMALSEQVAPRARPTLVVREADGAVVPDGVRALHLVRQRVHVNVQALDRRQRVEVAVERVVVVDAHEAVAVPELGEARVGVLARAAAGTDLEGNNLPKTPPLAASFTAQYQDYITSEAEATFAVTVSYRDDMDARIFNNPAVDNIPSHTLVNASAGLALDNGVSFNLIVQNLFDTDAASSRFTDVFGVFSTFDLKLPPRTIIGSLRYAF